MDLPSPGFDGKVYGFVLGLAALAAAVGLCAVVVGSLDNWKLALVLFVLPVSLGLLTLRDASSVLFALLLVSLSFSARFRPLGGAFHPGGAELALGPIDFPLMGLALLWLLELSRIPHIAKVPVRQVVLPFALFLSSHVLSIVPAPNRGLALLEILRLLKMALTVLIISRCLDSEKKIALAVRVLLLTVVLQGALAVVQSVFRASLGLGVLGEHEYWTISKGGITFGRAGGTLGHANVLANYFEVLTPIALALILSGARGRLRLLAYGAFLSGVMGTFLTFSRAGWASLLFGLSLVGFQHRKRLPRRQILAIILVIGLVGAAIGVLFNDIVVARFTTFWEGSRLVRTITAQTALRMFRSHPFLGVGANNYLAVSAGYVDPYVTPGLSKMAAAVVHNVPLLYAAELGLFGLVAFVWLVLSLIRLARQISRRAAPFPASLSTGVLAGMIALMAHGMWDWLFRYDPVFTLFWFSVGLLLALVNVHRRGQGHRQDTVG
jgi:O-antigen ligase